MKNVENDMNKLVKIILILFLFMPLGCTKHTVETKSQVDLAPVEIKPIHITIDINIKVDRALDDFFSDIDESAKEIK